MELAFGKGTVTIQDDVAGKFTIIKPQKLYVNCCITDHCVFIQEQLRRKIQDKKINSVSILVEDKTRINPEYPVLLNVLLDVLESHAVETIYLVPAYGTHGVHSQEEHEHLYGTEALNRTVLIEHNCKNDKDLLPVGKLQTGQVLKISGPVAKSDFIIALGSVAPHAFAGFTGGPKIILPGIADYETIRSNHSQVISPNAELCRLKDNPIHEQMMDALQLRPVDFAVQTVRTAGGGLASVFYGDLLDAYRRAVDHCIKYNGVTVSHRADIVVASCGGAPYDNSLYSAQRCIAVASKLVKQGGEIIIVGEFPKLIGDNHLEHCLSDRCSILERVKPEQIQIGMHSALLMIKNIADAKITFFSSWSEAFGKKYDLNVISSVSELNAYITKIAPNNTVNHLLPHTSHIVIDQTGNGK